MGNILSSINNNDSNIVGLSKKVDLIATELLLKQNTIDLLRITDKEYVDNLIILTCGILKEKFNNLELGFIHHRIKNGMKIYSTEIDEMKELTIHNNKLKNKIIKEISTFYIKVIIIFSAVVSTIDPEYKYKNKNGEVEYFYLKDFHAYKKIPRNVVPEIHRINNPIHLVRKRINILKNKMENNDDDFITIHPTEKLCKRSTFQKLSNEIGIKELDQLYNDVFNYKTKTWSKKSSKMKKKYNKDLTTFYRIFTGKSKKPQHVKSFEDIELLDFENLKLCQSPFMEKEITISRKNKKIKKYLEKIDNIKECSEENKKQLFYILKKIFLVSDGGYVINPKITLKELLVVESQTSDIILNLYTTCEKNFIGALIIYESLLKEQNININNQRLKNIDQQDYLDDDDSGKFITNNEYDNDDEVVEREPFLEDNNSPNIEEPIVQSVGVNYIQKPNQEAMSNIQHYKTEADIAKNNYANSSLSVFEKSDNVFNVNNVKTDNKVETVTTQQAPIINNVPDVVQSQEQSNIIVGQNDDKKDSIFNSITKTFKNLVGTSDDSVEKDISPVSETSAFNTNTKELEGNVDVKSIEDIDSQQQPLNSNAPPPVDVQTPLVNSNAPPPVDVQTPLVNSNAPTPVEEQPPLVNSNAPPPVEEQPPLVNSNAPPPVEEQPPLVNINAPPPVDVQTPVVNSNAPPPVEEQPPVVNINAPPPVDAETPVTNVNSSSQELQQPSVNPIRTEQPMTESSQQQSTKTMNSYTF